MPWASNPTRDPGQDVAGAGGGEEGGRISRNAGPAVGRGNDGVGALEDNYRTGDRGAKPRPLKLRSGFSSIVQGTEITSELSLMRGQDQWPASARIFRALASSRRLVRKACDRVGIEHHGAIAGKCRQHEAAGRLAHTNARPQRDRIQTTVGEEARASSTAPSTGRTITARFDAALTASASRGLASVTKPAPARNAPRAASRAAPVDHDGPDTHHGMAAVVFVALGAGHRKIRAPQFRQIFEGLRARCAPAPRRECRCRRPIPGRNAPGPEKADGRAFCERR